MLIVKRNGEGEEIVLQDDVNDPFHIEDVIARNPETVSPLQAELEMWLRKTNDSWCKI